MFYRKDNSLEFTDGVSWWCKDDGWSEPPAEPKSPPPDIPIPPELLFAFPTPPAILYFVQRSGTLATHRSWQVYPQSMQRTPVYSDINDNVTMQINHKHGEINITFTGPQSFCSQKSHWVGVVWWDGANRWGWDIIVPPPPIPPLFDIAPPTAPMLDCPEVGRTGWVACLARTNMSNVERLWAALPCERTMAELNEAFL